MVIKLTKSYTLQGVITKRYGISFKTMLYFHMAWFGIQILVVPLFIRFFFRIANMVSFPEFQSAFVRSGKIF